MARAQYKLLTYLVSSVTSSSGRPVSESLPAAASVHIYAGVSHELLQHADDQGLPPAQLASNRHRIHS